MLYVKIGCLEPVCCTPLWNGYALLDPNLHSDHGEFFT